MADQEKETKRNKHGRQKLVYDWGNETEVRQEVWKEEEFGREMIPREQWERNKHVRVYLISWFLTEEGNTASSKAINSIGNGLWGNPTGSSSACTQENSNSFLFRWMLQWHVLNKTCCHLWNYKEKQRIREHCQSSTPLAQRPGGDYMYVSQHIWQVTSNLAFLGRSIRAERKHFRIGMNQFLPQFCSFIQAQNMFDFHVISFIPSEEFTESHHEGLSHRIKRTL